MIVNKKEQYHLIFTHWAQQKVYDIWHWKCSFGLGQAHRNMTGLSQLMRSKPSPLDNWIFNSNTCINKTKIRLNHCITTMLIITFLFTMFQAFQWCNIYFWLSPLYWKKPKTWYTIHLHKTPQLKHAIMSCSMTQIYA